MSGRPAGAAPAAATASRAAGWAIIGGYVCRVHGGSAPQVRREARIRAFEAAHRRWFDPAFARWWQERIEWHAQRVMVTAELLGIPPGQVHPVAHRVLPGLVRPT